MVEHNFLIPFKRGFFFIFIVVMVYLFSTAFPWFLILSSVSWNLASLN